MKVAEELLEKRSVNYADRPRSVMCGELSGWGKIMLLSNYNDWFRQHRKWIAQEIGGHDTVRGYHKLIEYETRRFLRCVLNDPDRTQAHVRKYVCVGLLVMDMHSLIIWCRNLTSIILRITFGYKTIEGDDPLVDLAHVANSQLSLSTSPGIYYVDFVPLSTSFDTLLVPLESRSLLIIVKYIPSWLPGADFKQKSKQYAVVIRDLVEIPYAWTKSQLVRNPIHLFRHTLTAN